MKGKYPPFMRLFSHTILFLPVLDSLFMEIQLHLTVSHMQEGSICIQGTIEARFTYVFSL